MTIRLPEPKTKARFLMVGYGLILLFWMSLENRDVLVVTLLGAGTAIIFTGVATLNQFNGRELSSRTANTLVIAYLTITGAITPLVTSILMFFKSGWHGHLYPDFPPQLIWAMLTRIPIWSVAGLLTGISCAIVLALWQHKV